ncbi:MAG: hypothetical protein RR513_09505 [Muribaculaceae bacterium]
MTTLEVIGVIIGGLAALVAVIATILGGVRHIVKNAFDKGVDKNKIDAIIQKVDSLPCEQRLNDIKTNNNKHELITNTLNSNNEMLVEISNWVMKIDPNMIEQLTRKCSPYKITPIGEIVFEASGAKKSMETHLDFLITALEKINPQTAYDVEDVAMSVLLQNLRHELFNGIKNFLYKATEMIEVTDPAYGNIVTVKLSMQGILKLMSIRLRDEYLTKYPDIIK